MDKILYLDGVSDPGNMGTMIRTALAFNFDAVIVSENSVSIYNEKIWNSRIVGNNSDGIKLRIIFLNQLFNALI